MRVLKPVTPTPEQLLILEADTFSQTIVRGAAGSGKTTSAAHRARKVLAGVAAQRRIDGDHSPIRMLVLTFNRTLKGYIEEFITDGAAGFPNAELTVDTFAGWACNIAGYHKVIKRSPRSAWVSTKWGQVAPASRMSSRLIEGEIDFILGRYGRANRSAYIKCSRAGRGSPSIAETTRQTILDGVVTPYLDMLDVGQMVDWNDFAQFVLALGPQERYDIVVADEVQDFGVQQIRAILSKMKQRSSITFVIDSGQSIYPQVLDWEEAGVDESSAAVFKFNLKNNYRNTAQIAEFVQPLLQGMALTADGTIPDFRNCRNEEIGRTPELWDGKFGQQVARAVREILGFPPDETVGILTMWGDTRAEIATQLDAARIPLITLTRNKEWPRGPEVVASSTLHSAKGLEFDHVFVLGFDNDFLTAYGSEADATAYLEQRRLLAMAITRAKKSVFIGYRGRKKSTILDLLDPARFIFRDLEA